MESTFATRPRSATKARLSPPQRTSLGPAAFSRLLLPLLLDKPLPSSSSLAARGSLIFTGATASRKGSSKFGAFAVGKFGLSALAQSLAREFGPEGIHVAHVVLDGVLGKDSESRINPDSIASSFVYLHNQDRTAFTFELDLRPASERF
ncbi:hypothetical protein BDY24DRAFT_416029 [Mrakia frigida]|uniref:uncharacterized protein n=1 Tax=Mrakia frigida TaxID=29902 RepID=UPI003FCC1ADB